MQLYGNTIWNKAIPNSEKSILNTDIDNLPKIQKILDEAGINYCYYIRDNKVNIAIASIAVSSSEVSNLLKTPDFNVYITAPKNDYTPPDKNIIGNTNYNKIQSRSYQKLNTDIALKVAEQLTIAGIQFSGRVYDDTTTITVDKKDKKQFDKIVKDAAKQRAVFKKKIRSIEALYTEMSLNRFSDNQIKALQPLVDMCYFKDEEFTDLLKVKFKEISDYSISQLERYVDVYRDVYKNLHTQADVLFADYDKIIAIEKQIKNEILFEDFIKLRGFTAEQKECVKELIQQDISPNILNLIDYDFSPADIRKISDILNNHNSYENILLHIANIKEQSATNIHKWLKLNTYSPKTAEINFFSYQTENAVKEGEILKIAIETNQGLWNRLADYGVVYNENSEHKIILESNGDKLNNLTIFENENITNSIDVTEIMTSDEIMLMSEMIKTVQSELSERETLAKISKSVFVNFATSIIQDDITVRNAHENSDKQNYQLQVEITLKNLINDLTTEKLVITDYTVQETVNFINEYYNNTDLQKYIFDMISENVDISLTDLEKARAFAKGIEIPFSDNMIIPTVEQNIIEQENNKSEEKNNTNNPKFSFDNEKLQSDIKFEEIEQQLSFNSAYISSNETKKSTTTENNAHINTPKNFHITDNEIGAGTQGQRYQNNINAIKTLKIIELENRSATTDEQDILAKYVGWGGLAEYFNENNPHYSELKSILSEDEYSSARASTLDSFYTPPTVIDGIYQMLENSGFKGGTILEPALGIGNFFGRMPEHIIKNSSLYGVELDSISGRIAKQLYPNANIQITGFEKTKFQDNSFDVVIGNIPFCGLNIADNEYGNTLKIHDYFFLKALDKVKPGGIVAFVTSKGTLDKKDISFREELSEQADLLGAIRLPNNAFKANAGTDVTADILFLQKREPFIKRDIPDWINIGETSDGMNINQYFIDNPDMILGKIVLGNKLYGRTDDTMCIPFDNSNLDKQLQIAIQKIQANFNAQQNNIEPIKNDNIVIPDNLRNFSIFAQGNNIYYLENDTVKDINEKWSKKFCNANNKQRAKAYIDIRETVRELLAIQQVSEPGTDEKIKALQKTLNAQYDNFYDKYGLIHSRHNKQLFRDDVSFPLMLSLEDKIENDRLVRKSDIFTKRTIKLPQVIDHVDTSLEALSLSVAEKGKVDLDYMSALTDMPKQTVINELKGEIFPVPELSNLKNDNIVYQTASEYLSGDIYKKLSAAEIMAKNNDIFKDNIKALEEVIPPLLKAGDIDVQCGATWIPKEYYQQFMYETFGTPAEYRADCSIKRREKIILDYSPYTNTWNIENKSSDISVLTTKTYGTKKRSAYYLFEQVLNLKEPKVYQTVYDQNGNKSQVLDLESTKLVQEKAKAIKKAFGDWIFKDPVRRQELVDIYNKQFNCVRPRQYDGSAMTFPGMTASIELHEHQKNAIAHAVHGGNTLFAHCVGAGKTFEMIATSMECKRLGLCNKSMFVVPNHLTEQVGSDFLKLYPSANILVATKNDFSKKNRNKLMAKIATGNYDAVIIGHSQISMIPISPERQINLYKQQIDDITKGIKEMKSANGESFQVKQMELIKKSLQQKLNKLTKKEKDDTVYFEELGIDKLFVDEAHEFKNLLCVTKLQNVSGISGKTSQRALELFMKCRYLDEVTGGKGVVFATGTPISNSVTELHTMMRYLNYDFLCQHNMQNFDNWVSTFGKQKTDYELAPTGDKFKIRTRISEYANLPELMSMFKQIADVRTSDTLKLDVPECDLHIVNVEPTELQKEMVSELSERADEVNGGYVDPHQDNMLKITSDGRKVGLDPRLVDPELEDNPNTKLNQCVKNVLDIYKETDKDKLTQIIFCDLGTPKPTPKDTINASNDDIENDSDNEKSIAEIDTLEDCGQFCIYDDIKNKLIAQGISANEVAFIHDAKTEQQKSELFAKVRSGDIRVLIGSTAKMGTGTNVQERLIALHDLDVPWRPSDLEQRRGRMVRQGNINKKVHLYRYVTRGTFDAYSYQLLESKQRFISQIITSKTPARKCSDVDQEALTYAEIKALCTGDERIKEKLMLENRVKELRLFKTEYTNVKFELEDKSMAFPKKRDYLTDKITQIESDNEKRNKISFENDGLIKNFSIKINGTTYTNRQDAGNALEFSFSQISVFSDKDKIFEIGELCGFKISVVYSSKDECFKGIVKGADTYSATFGLSSTNNIKKLERTISQKIPTKLENTKNNLVRLQQDYNSAQEIIAKPFEFEDELSQKETRLAELTNILNAETIAHKNTPKQEKRKPYYFGKDKIISARKLPNTDKENTPLQQNMVKE